MLAYRSTSLENGYSPAELLMGQKICTTLLMSKKQLQSNLPNVTKFRKENKMRDRTKRNFDKRHSVKNLKPLSPGDTVWIPERETEGTVENEFNSRSYNVQTEDGTLRRNHRDLVLMPKTIDAQSGERSEKSTIDPTDQNQTKRSSSKDGTKTRSDRVSW